MHADHLPWLRLTARAWSILGLSYFTAGVIRVSALDGHETGYAGSLLRRDIVEIKRQVRTTEPRCIP